MHNTLYSNPTSENLDKEYDYIIVGAGPTGLTLAWLLSQEPTVRKILIVERAENIGGCHRVDRDPTTNLFTEHGPRIYSTTYVNVMQILSSMNINFYDIFTKYEFTHGSMSQEVLSKLTPMEIFKLGIEYIKLVFDPAYGLFTTVSDFLELNEFSKVGRDVIGKICHLTDGAGPERFTMNQLLHGFDHHVFYNFMQPRLPNDVALFPLWQDRLEKTGKIDIWTSSDVKNLEIPSTNKSRTIQGVTLAKKTDQGTNLINLRSKNVILAIPPEHALRISGLDNWTTVGRVFSSNANLIRNIRPIQAPNRSPNRTRRQLGTVEAGKEEGTVWGKVERTDVKKDGSIRPIVDTNRVSTISISEFGNLAKYDYYLPIVFHYPWQKEELGLPTVWGFPQTDWGVITILLSEYMNFNDPRSKTVITSCISLTNVPSSYTGLTANQTSDPVALMREVFRQANVVYKGSLPEPYFGLLSVLKDIPAKPYSNNTDKQSSINDMILQKGIMLISPGVSYDSSRNIWVNSDSAFINTPASGHLPNWENSAVPGLYWVGSLNGQSYYNFSSMESAMSNAIAFYLSKYNNPNYVVRSPINFSTVLRIALFIILLIVVFKYFKP